MKKNLLIIVPSLACGGQERVAALTADILKDYYNVYLLVFSDKDIFYNCSVPILCSNTPVCEGFKKLTNLLKRVLYIKKICRTHQIDFCYSLGNTANLANVLSKTANVRCIASFRGIREILPKNSINKIIIKYADAIVFVSSRMKEDFLLRFAERHGLYFLYNPYSIKKIKQMKDTPIGTITKSMIISVGRLSKQKGYYHLLHAIKLLKPSVPDISLILIGDGEERKGLESYIQENNLQKEVTLAGEQANPFAYMNKSNIYVLSSLSEGFPNSMVEAMVCGLPIIATNCISGPSEILDNRVHAKIYDVYEGKYGILIPPFTNELPNKQEDQKLADAIYKLLSDKSLQNNYRQKSLERSSEFSIEHYRNNIIRILEDT